MHKRKGQFKVQPSHAQITSKKTKILTECVFRQKTGPLRTLRLTLSSESAFSLSGGVSTGGTGDEGREKGKRANQMEMNTHERKVEAEVTRR